MQRLIILSQGRSGSTLLQRAITNSVDNAFISGENKNFWAHIYESYLAFKYIPVWETKIAEAKGEIPFSYNSNTDAYKPCWTNLMSEEELLNHFRQLFDTMYQAHHFDVIGFKEIRWHKDLKGYISFFRKLFPDIKFIFTVRNIDTLVTSGWWKLRDRELLLSQEKQLRSVKGVYVLDYEKMSENGLNEALNYLRLPYSRIKLDKVKAKKL